LQKAIRQVDPGGKASKFTLNLQDLDQALMKPTDMRLFVIAYAMYNKKYTVDKIHDLTKIDKVCRGYIAMDYFYSYLAREIVVLVQD